MRLMSKKRKVIVYEITPEMVKEKQKLNRIVIKEIKKLSFWDNNMTVKELIEILKDMPSDADVYHIEAIDGEPQEMYLIVTNVYQQDDDVMIY